VSGQLCALVAKAPGKQPLVLTEETRWAAEWVESIGEEGNLFSPLGIEQ
jgi:hypothetical protein